MMSSNRFTRKDIGLLSQMLFLNLLLYKLDRKRTITIIKIKIFMIFLVFYLMNLICFFFKTKIINNKKVYKSILQSNSSFNFIKNMIDFPDITYKRSFYGGWHFATIT